jgi:hypothetical protein
VSEMREVHANLVRASRLELGYEERERRRLGTATTWAPAEA